MFNPFGPVKIKSTTGNKNKTPSFKINKSLEDKNNLLLQLAMRKTKDNELEKIKSITEKKNKDTNNLLTKTLIKSIEKKI